MGNERTSEQADFHAEAEKLRAYATLKDTPLWPEGSSKTNFRVDVEAGDKGLSFLAKRGYEKLKYDPEKAKSAAILLSALFVEKIGPDPKLDPRDFLTIYPDHAELSHWKGDTATNEIVYFSESAETVAHAPVRLGLDPLPTAVVENRVGYRELSYDSKQHAGFRSFLEHMYLDAGYEKGPAAQAAGLLYGQFMEVRNGAVPFMKDGDQLFVGPDRAIFKPLNGPETTVSLADETVIHERYLSARSTVLDSSRMTRGSVFEATREEMDRFNDSLSNQLIGAIPNLIVYAKSTLVGGSAELVRVSINGSHYSVIRNSKGLYRVYGLSGADAPSFSNDTRTEWTSHFDLVKKALV